MAPAVLANLNEPLFTRRQCGAVFMRKHTNLSDDFTNNPNPNSTNKQFSDGDYVSFDLDSYSSNQLRELKKRLNSELEQVRFLKERIESGTFTTAPAHGIGLKKTNKKKKTVHGHGGLDLESEKALRSMMSSCVQILGKLMKHKWSWVFNTPVDVLGLGLHDYHLIVKKPMDLGTVKTNLEKGVYGSPVEFAGDVRLTFTNALAYNPKGQDVYKMAEKLLSQFDVWFGPVLKRFEAQQQGSSSRPRPVVSELSQRVVSENNARKGPEQISIAKKLDSLKPLPTLPPLVMELPRVPSPAKLPSPPPPQPVSKVETPPPQPPQPVNQVEAPLEVGEATSKGRKGKLPKPKAKDPNKREMTMEEKAKLGVNLQELPPEKLGQLIQILKKRTTNLPQDGDEIELDIEELDNETLWELDRFVTNYKKMASKIKRQGFIQNLSTPTRNMPPVMEMGSAEKRVRKGGDGGEEDVDIGEDIPIEDYPSVEIERDGTAAAAAAASGGSSSSGSSSSSDSDSGSSSGSDSDADSVQSPFVEAKGQ
ncbi:global transcription factor group E2 [Raphanus sativus]|nr:global transcription factor group E2 [Raphanus sativus]